MFLKLIFENIFVKIVFNTVRNNFIEIVFKIESEQSHSKVNK